MKRSQQASHITAAFDLLKGCGLGMKKNFLTRYANFSLKNTCTLRLGNEKQFK
jgi:hypothetical protein